MNFIKKIAAICCLTGAIFLVNGCSEGSTSFEHKSSIEVNTSSGVSYKSSYSEAKSENGLFNYKLNDVNLLDGKTEFYISITNNGKRDTTLNEITINFSATDSKGKVIREGKTHYNNLSINLPKDKEIYEVFAIEDPDYKKFDDTFNVHCDFTDVIINPDVQ